MFCDVRVCYRLMVVAVKECIQLTCKHLTRKFAQWFLNVLEWFVIMMDTQAIDVVTFDFKGAHVF